MPPNPDATPKFFEHLLKLYNLLEQEADGDTYVGYKSATFQKMGLSIGYQPRLYTQLTELGCIEQTYQGNIVDKSIIKLIHPPDLEAWRDFHDEGRRLTKRPTYAKLMEMITSVERRLPQGVDLGNYIIALESRLATIEAELVALKAEGGKQIAS